MSCVKKRCWFAVRLTIKQNNFQYFLLRSDWSWRINTFAQIHSGSDIGSNKKLLIKYERQRFIASYSMSSFWCLQITSCLNPSASFSFLKGRKKWWRQTFLLQGLLYDFEHFWILKVLSHFTHPSFISRSFLKQVASCMPADSKSFIRGGKRRETCQEQRLDSS